MKPAATIAAILLLGLLASRAQAVSLSLQQPGGQTEFVARLGEIVELEVRLDAGSEQVTGYSFYLAYDPQVLGLVPAGQNAAGQDEAFAPGEYLQGLVLRNEVVELEGENLMAFATAVGVQRSPRSGAGVAARCRFEVLRRPAAEQTLVRLVAGGPRYVSHFTAADRRGVEQRFTPPLGQVAIRVTGFRVRPLPDLSLVSGEPQQVFDLDDYTEQDGTQVLWTASRLSEISTQIDPESGQVTMAPQAGLVGERRMIFTALESVEGLTATDTIRIAIYARPQIEGLPDSLLFPEDGSHQRLDLDAFVDDLDDRPVADSLTWTAEGLSQVQAEVNAASHIALLSAAADWSGEELMRLAVRDREGNADTALVRVVVFPVNDPPQALHAEPIYPQRGGEPVRIPLSALIADKDDALNTLQIELQTEGGVTAQLSGDTLIVTGDAEGRGLVRFTVEDSSGARSEGQQVAMVTPAGQSPAPQIEEIPPLRFPAGGLGRLSLDSLAWDDGPAQALQWQATATPPLRAEVVEGQLRVGAEAGFSGAGNLTLKVRDAQGNEDEVTLPVEVIAEGQPQPPRIQAPGKIGLVVDQWQEVALDGLVDDPDDGDDQITWSWQLSPEAVVEDSLDQSRRRLYLRATAQVDPATLTLNALDPLGNGDQATVPLLITRSGEGPRLRPPDPVTLENLDAEARLDLDDFAFDGEDREGELAWSVAAPPGVEAEVDPASHLLKVRRAAGAEDTSSTALVALQVRDTDGKSASALLQVQLPPVFELKPFPHIRFYANQSDTSLALDEYVLATGEKPAITWSVAPAEQVRADLDLAAPHRVRLQAQDQTAQGRETLTFTAVDGTGRQRQGQVVVEILDPGVAPQVRAFPRLDVRQGEVNTALHLDDYVVDDDPDSALVWSANPPAALTLSIDPSTRIVSLSTQSALPSLEQVSFLVVDPAGNAASRILEVAVIQAGQPPQLAALPQLNLEAGGTEQRLGLDPFVSDADTPDENLSWEVVADQGVVARIENRQLVVAVPAGQSDRTQVRLRVSDPEGNQAQGVVQIEVIVDQQPPQLQLRAARHPLFAELLEIEALVEEPLRELPQILAGQQALSVEAAGETRYLAYYTVPRGEGEQFVDLVAAGFDRAGNEVRDSLSVALRWMDRQGGSLSSPDVQMALNAGDEAAGPGNLATVYKLDPRQAPPGSGDQPVYAVDLTRGRDLLHPVALNFYVGAGAPEDRGIRRWNEEAQDWEALPTNTEPGSGWLSTTVDRLGLFQVGAVDPEQRRASQPLSSFPNPCSPAAPARIVYEVEVPGPVRLEIFNMLGQPVRLLVDKGFQDVGTWSASWDGRDQAGQLVGSGRYLCRLQQRDQVRRQSLLLVR